MASELKVSLVIPCFNAGRHLRECLDSAVRQKLSDIEIICVNDGSVDSTLSILEEYAGKDKRIKIIDKKNTGYGDSMNLAFSRARGEYFGILESDDVAEPGMLELLYQVAKQHDLDIARGRYNYMRGSSLSPEEEKGVPRNEVIRAVTCIPLLFAPPAIWASLYKASWLKKNNIGFLPTPGASFQDLSFNFKAYALAERFCKIDADVYRYRVDNQNSSINSKSKKFCVCMEWEEIYRFVEERKLTEVGHLLPEIQFNGYRWNCNRLPKEDRVSFLKAWSRELASRNRKGLIPWKKMSPRYVKRLWLIKNFPMIYYLLHLGKA